MNENENEIRNDEAKCNADFYRWAVNKYAPYSEMQAPSLRQYSYGDMKAAFAAGRIANRTAKGQELRSTTADPVSDSHTPAPAAAPFERELHYIVVKIRNDEARVIRRIVIDADSQHDAIGGIDARIAARTLKPENEVRKDEAFLVEAWNFGQFADDFDRPLAKEIRALLRRMAERLAARSSAPVQSLTDAANEQPPFNINEAVAYAKRMGLPLDFEGVGRTESAPGQDVRLDQKQVAQPVTGDSTSVMGEVLPAPAADTIQVGSLTTLTTICGAAKAGMLCNLSPEHEGEHSWAADHSDTPEWSALQKKHRIEQTEFDSGKLKTMSAERDLKASQHNEEIELLISLERRLAAETKASDAKERDRQYHMDAINRLASFLALSGTSFEVVQAAIDNMTRLAASVSAETKARKAVESATMHQAEEIVRLLKRLAAETKAKEQITDLKRNTLLVELKQAIHNLLAYL